MDSNKTDQIINSLSQGAIATGGYGSYPKTFSTLNGGNHAKRPLLADSSLEKDQIEQKKTGTETFPASWRIKTSHFFSR